jgi:hypothetical protein
MNSTTRMLGMPPRIEGTLMSGKPGPVGGPTEGAAIGPGRTGDPDGDPETESEAEGDVVDDG